MQVKEVYGGEGKVKVKKKNKQKVFSFKYTGPERGAHLLEGEELFLKGNMSFFFPKSRANSKVLRHF